MTDLQNKVIEYLREKIKEGHHPIIRRPGRILNDCREVVSLANDPFKKEVLSGPIDWSVQVDVKTWENLFLLSLCNVHLGTRESWEISRLLHELKVGHESARFWGKISTEGGSNYYIAEVETEECCKYFCLSGLDGIWQHLPEGCTSYDEEFCLTGSLNFSSEAETLAKIVIQISKACCVDVNKFGTDARIVIPSLHCHPGISLNAFRHARESLRNAASKSRRTLDKDESGSWSLEFIGDPNVYVDGNDEERDISLGNVHISSNIWPGAHFALSGYLQRSVNCYIGNGRKRERFRN